MSNEHLTGFSTSLILRKMHIRTIRYHIISIRIFTIKKIGVREDVEKLEPLCTVGEIAKWCSQYGKLYGGSSKLWEYNYHVVQQSHVCVYTQKNWQEDLDIYSTYEHSHSFIIAPRSRNNPNVHGQMNGILFYLKRKKILSHAITWTNLEDVMLSEISSHKKTNTVWSHLYAVAKVVEFIETESRMLVTKDWG